MTTRIPYAMEADYLINFVIESNRIEGIHRDPTPDEISETRAFLAERVLLLRSLENLVAVYQPDARLRSKKGLDVRVGKYLAPPGGIEIKQRLMVLLTQAQDFSRHPYEVHQDYEHLHPFTDGNGRSGRALWLWMMLRMHERSAQQAVSLGFLHTWYYQSLSDGR